MTLVIAYKSDLRPVTQKLTEHPEWVYVTEAGENGEIVIRVKNAE